MSTQSLGTFRWAHRETILFVSRFTAWLGIIFIFSLPAVVVTVGVLPQALAYLIAGIVAIAITLTGMDFLPDEEEEVDFEDSSWRDMLTFIIVIYTMLAAGFSVILISGVLLGIVVGAAVGSPTIALLIALLFPVVDREAGKHMGHSLFGLVTLAVITCFDMLSTIYRLSGSVREQARRGRRRMIN